MPGNASARAPGSVAPTGPRDARRPRRRRQGRGNPLAWRPPARRPTRLQRARAHRNTEITGEHRGNGGGSRELQWGHVFEGVETSSCKVSTHSTLPEFNGRSPSARKYRTIQRCRRKRFQSVAKCAAPALGRRKISPDRVQRNQHIPRSTGPAIPSTSMTLSPNAERQPNRRSVHRRARRSSSTLLRQS